MLAEPPNNRLIYIIIYGGIIAEIIGIITLASILGEMLHMLGPCGLL